MEYRTFVRKLRKLGDIPVPIGHVRRRKGTTTYFFCKSAKPKVLEFLTENLGESSVVTSYVQETLSFKADFRVLFHDLPTDDFVCVGIW